MLQTSGQTHGRCQQAMRIQPKNHLLLVSREPLAPSWQKSSKLQCLYPAHQHSLNHQTNCTSRSSGHECHLCCPKILLHTQSPRARQPAMIERKRKSVQTCALTLLSATNLLSSPEYASNTASLSSASLNTCDVQAPCQHSAGRERGAPHELHRTLCGATARTLDNSTKASMRVFHVLLSTRSRTGALSTGSAGGASGGTSSAMLPHGGFSTLCACKAAEALPRVGQRPQPRCEHRGHCSMFSS